MFKEELSNLVRRLRDVKAVVLIGLDGIPIEKITVDKSLNIDALSAEYISILKKTLSKGKELNTGRLLELSIFTDKLEMVIQSVTPEYFLIVILPSNGNFGRVRFELKKLIPRFAAEIG